MCPGARRRRGLRRDLNGSALPTLPQSVPRGARLSRLHWFATATACQVARPPWTDLTEFPRPPETFTSRLPAGRSPSPSLDMTTTDGVMGLAWMSCAVRWSSPDRMEVRGHGVHQPQASRTEDDHGALCRFGRVLERDVGLHRGWGGQDHPRDEGGLGA